MSDIRVISASAGSGKTYTLAEELFEAITRQGVRPEAVVVTTFTVKAAAELQERVRTRLLQDGKVRQAAALMAARIGTVDSICHGLIRDYAFDLAISPEVGVQEAAADGGVDPLLAAAVSDVLTPQEQERLEELGRRFGWDTPQWEGQVQQIVRLARTNAITAGDLARSAERSERSLLRLLGPAVRSGTALDRALLEEIRRYLQDPNLLRSTYKADLRTAERLREVLPRLVAGEPLGWPEWIRLQRCKATTRGKTKEPFQRVLTALAGHDRHPRLREDLGAYLELAFGIAARALERYQGRKAAQGVVDFTDMEALAYELLQRNELRDRLAPDLDLVLVDEFQDTNPLQLAIFLLLGRCAGCSVWVGDQKQSIYRFRGADPALMESAIEALYPDRAPQTLPHCWRSRPELIRLTSTLFVPAFEAQGILAERVRLTPPPPDEMTYPEGLGAAVEHWRLLDEDGAPAGVKNPWDALAAGVGKLLSDRTVKVRDRRTGSPRPVEPRDVAILPFYRQELALAAAALERAGIPAAVGRDTLGGTAEGQLALALLRLWAAPGDTLAAATVARLLDHPDDPHAFLTRGLARPREAAYADQPVVRAVRQLAADRPWLGVLDAFDRVVALAGLRDLCRRWGGAEQRLANLEALRGYVASYVDGADRASTAVTPTGAIAWLSRNATEEALPPTANAVTAVNWHRAKGLEWPVVILLFDSRRSTTTDIFDVGAVTDRPDERLALGEPLAGRWIRCWVNPYGKMESKLPFLERLADDPAARRNLAQLRREELRLLYVIFTRARDRLILAQPGASLVPGTLLEELNVPDAAPVVHELAGEGAGESEGVGAGVGAGGGAGESTAAGASEGAGEGAADGAADGAAETETDVFDWAGLDLPMVRRTCRPAAPVERSVRPEPTYPRRAPRPHPPAYRAPSDLEGAAARAATAASAGSAASSGSAAPAGSTGSAKPTKLAKPAAPAEPAALAKPTEPAEPAALGEITRLGAPIPVSGRPVWNDLGQAVHGFLAADPPTANAGRRRTMAARLLSRWQVADHCAAESLVEIADRLSRALGERWPRASASREWPILLRDDQGTTLRGEADLVLETPEGFVIIDHKAVSGDAAYALKKAVSYGAQLDAYARALEAATGREVLQTIIHLPLQGLLVPVMVSRSAHREGAAP